MMTMDDLGKTYFRRGGGLKIVGVYLHPLSNPSLTEQSIV